MADRHENNWQPVRPLEDDLPDDRGADPAVSPEPTIASPAAAVDTAPVPDAKPANERKPFRSTPITMPPEGVDNLPTASREATPRTASPVVVPKGSTAGSKSAVEPTDIVGEAGSRTEGAADRLEAAADSGAVVSSDEAAVSVDEVDGTTASRSSANLPTTPVASPEQTAAARPSTLAPPPEAKPIESPPVQSGPPPPQQWRSQNHGVPQNYWGPQNNRAPQNAWAQPQGRNGPQGQSVTQGNNVSQGEWSPQNQWAAQAGQWPQLPHPQSVAPLDPRQQGAVDARGPGFQAGAVGEGLSGDRPIAPPASSADLGNSLLIRSANVPPVSGWRRALYVMSGGRIDVGNSAAQQRRLELTAQADRTLVGCYRVAVLSLKGGVGKTTTTATLGSTFADIRGDRVIAIDANPDRGTLGQKVPCETTATVRNLLRDIDSLYRYSDVRAYTSQNANRLEVLASDSDPAASEAFSGEDYDRAVDLLEKFYSIVITDCGTGLMHSAMESILEGTDTLVVVSSASVDGVRSASATLDWLDAHGYRALVATSVAVINGVRPREGKVDLQKVIEHFEQRCAHVRTIPFDPHLEEGAEIELDRLRGRTRTALLEVAAAVAAGFPDTPTAARHNQ